MMMRHKRLRNAEIAAAITRHQAAMIGFDATAAKMRWWRPWRWKECILALIDADREQAIIDTYKHAMEGGRK